VNRRKSLRQSAYKKNLEDSKRIQASNSQRSHQSCTPHLRLRKCEFARSLDRLLQRRTFNHHH